MWGPVERRRCEVRGAEGVEFVGSPSHWGCTAPMAPSLDTPMIVDDETIAQDITMCYVMRTIRRKSYTTNLSACSSTFFEVYAANLFSGRTLRFCGDLWTVQH
jgi:hypothetical protein